MSTWIDSDVTNKVKAFKNAPGRIRWTIACVVEANANDEQELHMVTEALDRCREVGEAKIVDVRLLRGKAKP